MFEKPGSYLFKIKCAPNTEQVGCSLQGPRPEMVTKSFGKRKREISCRQWEGPNMHSRCLAFFSYDVLGGVGQGGERDFLVIFPSFLMCSQYVPFKFPIGSHDVPQFCNVFLNMCSIAPHFYPNMPWKNGVLLSPIQVGQRGGTI